MLQKKFITTTEAEIERRIEDAYEKLLLKDLDLHYKINVPLWLRRCLWTMHSRYGWGKKRLNQFLGELIEEHKCINENYAKARRIFDVINRIADRRWNSEKLY